MTAVNASGCAPPVLVDAPVDVLAVIDQLIATYSRGAPFPPLSRVTEARAAVAELVEAARYAVNAHALRRADGAVSADWPGLARLRAALAPFGGAK